MLENYCSFDDSTVQHVFRDENTVANNLAQQASGFQANQGKFGFLEKPDVPVCQTGQSGFQLVHNVRICSVETNSLEPDSSVSETGGSRIFRTSDETSKTTTVSYPVSRKREQSLHTCAQDVQITRTVTI
jgi:hypothetical protein